MSFRLLKPATLVDFHYRHPQTTDADGYKIKGTPLIIVRECFVSTSGARPTESVLQEAAMETWDAEIGWYEKEGETDTSGTTLEKVKIEGVTLYPNDELPRGFGVGGMRMGTSAWRTLRCSRVNRGGE